jgi:hypothetical protein
MRLLSSVLLIFLAAAAPAAAQLVPQRSLGGIKLGMTEKEVRAERGAPDKVTHPNNEIVGRTTEYRYGLTRVSIFPSSGVVNISTTSRRETYRGVGVGSTEAALKRAVKGERCETASGERYCYLGRFEPGRIVTIWNFTSRGKIKLISLGRIID